MTTFFVSNQHPASQTYRIMYREVRTRTHKGYPVTYEMKSLPDDYPSWEEALAAINRLNVSTSDYWQSGGLCPPSPY